MRVAILFIILLMSAGIEAETISREINVIYPENIQFLMEKFKSVFEKENENVRIVLQSGPEPDLIQKINEGNVSADLIIVSDDRLIRPLLKPFYSEEPSEFMMDEIVLIAGKDAKYFDQLQIRKWHESLMKPEVKIAIPDKKQSYSAYRVPLVWKLAETWVHNLSLYENLSAKVNETQSGTSTVSALKAGTLDYVFDYATQAKQQGLRKFKLFNYYNLGDPSLAHVYKSAVIEVSDEKGEKKLIHGEPIIYSIGVLKGTKKPELAKSFLEFVSGPAGEEILKSEEITPIQ